MEGETWFRLHSTNLIANIYRLKVRLGHLLFQTIVKSAYGFSGTHFRKCISSGDFLLAILMVLRNIFF